MKTIPNQTKTTVKTAKMLTATAKMPTAKMTAKMMTAKMMMTAKTVSRTPMEV